jgi:hypothetical protein
MEGVSIDSLTCSQKRRYSTMEANAPHSLSATTTGTQPAAMAVYRWVAYGGCVY